MARCVNLRSRQGDGFLTLTISLLPFFLLVMALGIDGLALAASYNRAVGLARTAAQAGATRIDFDGGGVSLRGDACVVAVQNACVNAGGCGPAASATCTQAGNGVEVWVTLKPIRVFGAGLGFGADKVVARARSSPRFGINIEE